MIIANFSFICTLLWVVFVCLTVNAQRIDNRFTKLRGSKESRHQISNRNRVQKHSDSEPQQLTFEEQFIRMRYLTLVFLFYSKFTVKDLHSRECPVYDVHVQRFEPAMTAPPVGIACKCDWILTEKRLFGRTARPKTIFVAARALYLLDMMLNVFTEPFVLISAINDETIPVNYDKRLALPKGFAQDPTEGTWARILNHPMVTHWFVENRSPVNSSKVSTMPIMFVHRIGEIPPDQVYVQLLDIYHRSPRWAERPIQLLSSDRVRNGQGQWRDRAILKQLCIEHPLCTVAYTKKQNKQQELVPISHRDPLEHDTNGFERKVRNAKFLIMAHGGGFDPCPKLVHSILLGTIPIIQSTPLDDAYSQLPVVIIPNLEHFLALNNTQQAQRLMDQWGAMYAPYYEPHSALRNQTLHRLSQDYWWKKVQSYVH